MEKDKKLEIFRAFGNKLAKKAHWFLQNSFKIKKTEIGRRELEDFISQKTGLPKSSIAMYDRRYYLTDWAVWQKLIEYDWTNEKQYKADIFDCDNFSSSFCSRMAEIYELNTAGRFSCELRNPITNKHIGDHRAVIIPTQETDGLHLFVLESQNDKWTEVKKGQPIVIGNWKYVPGWIELN